MLLGNAWIPAAVGQNFIPQGPAPSSGPADVVQSGDGPDGRTGTVAGAVQAIVADPVNPNTMYIGVVNGGVWVTHTAGVSWTPLSDNQRSLSIASLAMDPSNSNILVAGTGVTSNGFVGGTGDLASRGGPRIGLLLSANGGASWSEVGGATLAGKSIVGVEVRGGIILAAAAEPHDAAAAGGLFISNNGGGSFQPITLGSGGGTVAVTSLAADRRNQSVFYAAVNSTVAADRGVYFSDNTGASWTKGLDLAPGQIARLATGPDGAVVAAVYAPADITKPDQNTRLVALMLSKSGGAVGSWINLGAPAVNPGGQASTNLAVAIDKNNPNIVYVAGDANDNATLAAFSVTLNADGTATITSLTDSGTSNTTVHADARNFVFDAGGRLIMVGDGGVYALTHPQGTNGVWTGLNSTLQVREAYAIGYDAVSKRLIVAAQDTGTAVQNAPNSPQYTAIGGGDGINTAVNDKTLHGRGESAIYTSSQQLGNLERRIVNSQGLTIGEPTTFVTTKGQAGSLNFQNDDFTEDSGTHLPFSSKVVLNRIDPTMIAFGTNYVYTTVDENASADTLHLTNIGSNIGPVTALAYGTQDNINALVAGSAGGLFLSTAGGAGSLHQLPNYGGGTPSSVVFDPRTEARFYAADTASVWGTTDTGASFGNVTPPGQLLIRPTSLEFISSNGVNALLVGGLGNALNAQSPIVVADSDNTGNLSPWRAFGFGLPNAIANQLVYNRAVDVLAVSLFGRGAWLLYDVTAYFPSALVLRFGLADNDSAPPDSILTNGNYANRNLEKLGTGTLTIDGTTSYTGTTSVLSGRLLANGNLASSSSLFVDAGGTLGGIGIVPTTTVNGVLTPGNPTGTLTVNGNLTFNPGSFYRVALAGTTTATRANVIGTAALSGTTEASFSGATFTRSYTILSAAGGLDGTFGNLTTAGLPGFFNTNLGYTATEVTLNLQSEMAATPGLGGDQISVARVLDTAFNAGPGWDAMPALFSLSSAQLPNALLMLSGDNASVGQSMEIAAGGQFTTLLTNRAGVVAGRAGQSTAASPSSASVATPCGTSFCELPRDWNAWAAGFGGAQWLNADPLAGSSAAQQSIGGTAAGIDYRVDTDSVLGVGAGVSSSAYSVSATGATGRATGAHFGLYGQHDWRGFYLATTINYSRFDGNATRPITGIGTTETARSYAVSNELGGRIEIGRPFEVKRFDGGQIGLTPLAALQPMQLWTPGMTESSVTASGTPGVFALNYQPTATTSLPLFLGTQFDLQRELDGGSLRAWLRTSWVHEFMTGRGVTAGFNLLPGSSFDVDGARAASDAARLDFGLNYALGGQTSLFANASAEFSDRSQSIAGTAGVKLSW